MAAEKTVPLMQAVPLPYDQVSFQRDGQELTRYHFGPDLRRPFLYPVIGASGRSLTRMGHPHDPESHSHHNSIWISHNDVNGVSFWDDRSGGRIVHQRIERFTDSVDSAALLAINSWVVSNKVFLAERRLVTVRPFSARGEAWMIIIDIELMAKDKPVTLGKTPFGLLGVRMAKSIGVNDGGGRIRNSEGAVNESEVLWKRAKWMDYSGPIAPGAIEGITLMDHPQNPNHPTYFHVRNDGWMGASLTYAEPRRIEPGENLRLRYGLYMHRGTPPPDELHEKWRTFIGLPIRF